MGRREQGRSHAQLSHGASRSQRAAPAAASGHWAENLVAEYLVRGGWRVLARNYRLRGGELDIVCEDEDGTVVIVEVKQRLGAAFGGAAAAIDARKLSRLRSTATHLLAFELGRPDAAVRFDAVLVTGSREHHRLEHLEDIA